MHTKSNPAAWTLVYDVEEERVKYQAVDQVLAWLSQDIENFRAKSFRNFGLTIIIFKAKTAHSTYWSGKFIGYDEYEFSASNIGPICMRVKVESPGKVVMAFKGRWTSVADYMATLEPAVDENEPVQGGTDEDTLMKRVGHQQRWWAETGKTFKIMELPSDIRTMIFEYAIGNGVQPYPTHKSRKLRGTPFSPPMVIIGNPNTSLLYTSKLVYEEVSYLVFEKTKFFVDRFQILRKLLKNREQAARIRKLTLSMTHLDYAQLFDPRGVGKDGFPKSLTTAKCLKNMDLEELKMYFLNRTPRANSTMNDNVVVVPSLLRDALPFVKGQAVQVFAWRPSVLREFRLAVAKELKSVDDWHKLNEALGLGKKGMKDYHEEMDGNEEEDGGVAVPPEESES